MSIEKKYFERNHAGGELTEKGHADWLQFRKDYIGGSDAGAIIGMSPYRSAFTVWAEKTGGVQEFQGNVITKVGSYLEALVARMFEEQTGKKVRNDNATLVNSDYPWACADLDRIIVGEDAILECKTTNSYLNVKKFRNGEYPDMWMAQMTHYLAVTGKSKAYLAVLSECRDFHVYELERDEDEIKALMDAEKDFWNRYVLTKKAPPVDGSDSTTETVRTLFGTEYETDVNLEALKWKLDERAQLGTSIRQLTERKQQIENEIKVAMGGATRATAGSFSISFRTQGTAAFNAKAFQEAFPNIDITPYKGTARVLRITEKKTS